MAPDELGRDRQEYIGLIFLIAMVGGFTLSFSGTPFYERSLIAWLGYPQYDLHAFLVGLVSLVGLVYLGYRRHG